MNWIDCLEIILLLQIIMSMDKNEVLLLQEKKTQLKITRQKIRKGVVFI